MKVLYDTLAELDLLRTIHDSVLVGYSGGKDSLACLSLAKQKFKHVECFHMETIPGGFEKDNDQLRVAEDLWEVKIHRYTHWAFTEWIAGTAYNWDSDKLAATPRYNLEDVLRRAQADSGIKLTFWGAKLADSMYRRRTMAEYNEKTLAKTYPNVHFPIKHWKKHEVLAFLKVRGIPLPPSSKKAIGGFGLKTAEVCALHDDYPSDYAKVERWFPFVGAVVARREFHGVTGL